MKQVGAVAVDLDTGLRFGFRVGITAEVPPSLNDQDPLAELAGRAFGKGQAEKSRADDDQVIRGHWRLGYRKRTALTPSRTRRRG